MRDPGPNYAIDTVGGVAQLAHKIGVAQPSASNWNRVPAQRVIAIEAATGASHKQLRSDLSSEPAVKDDAVDPVDAARAQEYALLAALLWSAPSNELLGEIARLRGDATPLGRAHAALAEAASETAAEIEREYFDLFVGLGRGELLPYGSYYLTGFLNARHRAGREEFRTGGSCGDAVRDHGGPRWQALPGIGRNAAPILRETCGAMDGPSVCRYGNRRKRQILPIGRIAWPPVSENRNRSIYFRQLTNGG